MGFLTAEQVAEFLKQNPGFFESHVEVLMNLQIPHPHGGRAVSIGERQLVAAREKAKMLEEKLREMIARWAIPTRSRSSRTSIARRSRRKVPSSSTIRGSRNG